MRKAPVQGRSRATVDAIVEAAARILVEQGYDKASTNVIAATAGVSIGSLYEYFPGKEAIFAEIRRREDARLFALTMEGEEPTSVAALIRRHVAIYLRFVRANLELHAALINDVPQFAVGKEELPFYRDYMPWASAFLEAHREELRHDAQIGRATELTVWVTRSTIDSYVLHSPESLSEELLDDLIEDLLCRFLLADA